MLVVVVVVAAAVRAVYRNVAVMAVQGAGEAEVMVAPVVEALAVDVAGADVIGMVAMPAVVQVVVVLLAAQARQVPMRAALRLHQGLPLNIIFPEDKLAQVEMVMAAVVAAAAAVVTWVPVACRVPFPDAVKILAPMAEQAEQEGVED